MRQPFYLVKYNSKKNGLTFYYKAWDGDTLKGDWPTGKNTKMEALIHCAQLQAMNELIPKPRTKRDMVKQSTLTEFAESFWDYDKSKYIQGLLLRGRSYTRTSAENSLGIFKNHIKPFFGDRKLNSISSIEIEEWLLLLSAGTEDRKPLSGKSCNNILNNIKIMFKMALKWGMINDNPAVNIDPLQKKQIERGILTPTEVKDLFDLSTVKTIWKDHHIEYVANFLSCTTGMRQGEILALKAEQVYDGYIEVKYSFERKHGLKGTKNGKTRFVPILEEVQELLSGLEKMNGSGFLLSSDGGVSPIPHTTLNNTFYRALEKIGIADKVRRQRRITFHSWRHFYNTTLRVAGAKDAKVQSLVGHATIAMTENYSHFRPEDFEHEKNIIQGVFSDVG